jgi:hypothetical protein
MRCAWISLIVLSIFFVANFTFAAETDPPKDLWPDVYPSHNSAAQGVAQQIAAALDQFSQPRSKIFIWQESSSSISSDVRKEIATVLSARFPAAHVQIDRPADADPAAPSIQISGSEWWSNTDAADFGDKGEIIATLSGPTTATFHGKFDHKLWVDDFSSFVNSQPSTTWLVGQSNHFCATVAEADDLARDDLANQLAADIQKRVASIPNHRSYDDIQSYAHNMVRGIQVNDKFLQQFNAPHGALWQEAVLYNADNQQFSNFIDYAVSGGFSASVKYAPKQIGPMILLVVVILALYAFLNWITKGYFTTRLKIVALVLAVIGVASFLLLFFGDRLVVHNGPAQVHQVRQSDGGNH